MAKPGVCLNIGRPYPPSRFGLALTAVALLASGCMVGPDFQRPKAQLAGQWMETGTPTVDTHHRQDRDWWLSLKDPVLSNLIGLAQRQNLSLRSVGVRVLQARAQLGIAIGELYPQQQQLSTSINYNRIPISVPYNVVGNNYWQAAFGAQAGWEIDLWGKLRRGIESADAVFLASVANYDDVLVTLTGDAASIYVKIRTIETQLAIARENVVRQRQALAIAQARFAGGVVTKRDVYQAENVLGSTEASIPKLELQRRQATNALSVLLGMPPDPLDGLLAGSTGIPVAPETLAVGIPADLLRRRPDIRQAELNAAAQCAQIGFAKGDLLPAFYLVGNVGTLSTDIGKASLSKLFSAGTLAYSVGPQVTWNILNYGQITNNVRVQDAKFQALLVEYQNTVLKAQQEVEDGIAEFGQSRLEVGFLQKSVEAAKGAMDIALLQYKDGVADFTTVLNAEENLYKAQNNLATAQGQIPLGLIKAYRAMGGGWEVRENRDFVPAAMQEEMARRTDWGKLLNPDLLRPQAPALPSAEDVGPTVRPPEW
ncbi:MAG: efflux transporter outer membrane subunit [Candidatus Methylumidiphilus sp.]